LTLADGTQVWLNAGSSIAYPTVFTGKQRTVSVTGEVYFEVAHNKQMPFVVQKGAVSVQVLGTHFNMNTYDDESALKVTLLEGSVKVVNKASSNTSAIGNKNHQEAILKPGEQVSISHTSQLSQPIPVQTEEVMAWKN